MGEKEKVEVGNAVVGVEKKRSVFAGLVSYRYIGGAIIILIAAAVTVSLALKHNQEPNLSSVCSSRPGIINQAAANLQPYAIARLAPIAVNVMGLPNFQRDPNCLYIVTTFYLNGKDPVNAQKYLKLLDQSYNGSNISSSLIKVKSVSSLKTAVNAESTEFKNNPYGYNFVGVP